MVNGTGTNRTEGGTAPGGIAVPSEPRPSATELLYKNMPAWRPINPEDFEEGG